MCDAAVLPNEERQKCEIWTRVMGYHRPESSFNIGKKGEYRERKCFTEIAACQHLPAMLRRQAV